METTNTKKLYRLHDYTVNYWDDWDNMSLVWNDVENKVEVNLRNSSRFGSCKVEELIEASKEILEKAAASLSSWFRERVESTLKAEIGLGDTVKFVKAYKSRKTGIEIKAGETGRVFWKGKNKFVFQGRNQPTIYSFGIEMADGRKCFVGIEKLEKEIEQAEVEKIVDCAVQNKTIFQKYVSAK